MKTVKGTTQSAAFIREMRGYAAYWLEKMSADLDDGAQAARDKMNITPSGELATFYETIVNDANRALTELGEPTDAIPDSPLRVS